MGLLLLFGGCRACCPVEGSGACVRLCAVSNVNMIYWTVEFFSAIIALVVVLGAIVALKRKEFDESPEMKRLSLRMEQEYYAALLRKRHNLLHPYTPIKVEEEPPKLSSKKSKQISRENIDGSGDGDEARDDGSKKGSGLFSRLGSTANAATGFVSKRF